MESGYNFTEVQASCSYFPKVFKGILFCSIDAKLGSCGNGATLAKKIFCKLFSAYASLLYPFASAI